MSPVVVCIEDGEKDALETSVLNVGLQKMQVSFLLNPSELNKHSREKENTKRSNLFGDCWIEKVMRRKYVKDAKELRRELKKRKEALVLSGGCRTQKAWTRICRSFSFTKTTGLLRCTDASTMSSGMPFEVTQKCAETVNWQRRYASLDEESDWNDLAVLEDDEASNAYTKSIMWQDTDFLRHVESQKRGERSHYVHVCW